MGNNKNNSLNSQIVLKWTWYEKLNFLFAYLFYKLILIFEIQSPKFNFVFFEFRYSITNFINTLIPQLLKPSYYNGPEIIKTHFSQFKVRNNTLDAALISPAFERSDLNLLDQILNNFDANKPIGAFDIGANIGKFTIHIGTKHKEKKIKIWSFEPIPENIKILKENIHLNNLNINLCPFALGDKEETVEMNFSEKEAGNAALTKNKNEGSVKVQKFVADKVFNSEILPQQLFIKIDVEGHELEVLNGLQETFKKTQICVICIEDIFKRDELYDHLLKQHFAPLKKLTPYNSWWVLKKQNLEKNHILKYSTMSASLANNS